MNSNKKFLLKGKVSVETLPIAASVNDSGLKRLLLDKGELAQFYNSSEPIHLIAYIEFPDGSTRGGHYHPSREEKIYIIRGHMILAVQDIESGEYEVCEIAEGDLISISPKIAHAIKTVKSGHAIEFSSKTFDTAGTIHYPFVLNHL